MKASELSCKDFMVGDWVIPHVYDSKLEPSKIVGIHYNSCKGKDYVDWVDCEAWDELSLSDIEPIPLTAEILEKNGFENIGDDTYQLEEPPCWFWVDFFNHQYGCEYDTSTYEYEDDEHRLKLYGIPSVHQLQHALKLCGIEKEIVL
jgi:hypothetical protein